MAHYNSSGPRSDPLDDEVENSEVEVPRHYTTIPIESSNWRTHAFHERQLRWALKQRADNDYWGSLLYIVLDDRNLIMQVWGLTGSGKSEVAFTTAKWLKIFFDDCGIPSRIIFTQSFGETVRKVKTAIRGDTFVQDEMGRPSGEGSRNLMYNLINIIEDQSKPQQPSD